MRYGTEAFLSIGNEVMLKTLKLFTAYNVAEGHPINDWTQVTKKHFDDFRSSDACIAATEKDNSIGLSTHWLSVRRKFLMASGLVMHVLIPLKWMTTSCYQIFLLLVKTKVIQHPVTHVLMPL